MTAIMPTLLNMDILSASAAVFLFFMAIKFFIYFFTGSNSTRKAQHSLPLDSEQTTSPDVSKGDSGSESSEDDDFDGLAHLRAALRMVDQTFAPRTSSTTHKSDDFEVFADFASASQRRAMQGMEREN
ncbi:uncharacterized protein CLAFUR5_13855 [Fulvia fulva]|uniref:Uncharacterized protein n=1 Tax=Passalora fulva TaxID=5499 RepID=A0A9Q8PKX2_PASFU|nr:uncharacterized protein CLAFUR5_13855 [Fulvia fulva]UJO24316.1 hypothetical protein CLAFUR5_13855 [Fulvia fulva]WPV36984.1 hypothetical protein CLAFUW7_14026 [Fulvia fulva]